MQYQHCIFDLYGTLVDIHTDEASPRLWVRMAEVYRRKGALYQPGELRESYIRLVNQLENGAASRSRTPAFSACCSRSAASPRTAPSW